MNSHSGNEKTRSILMKNYWILRCLLTVRQTVQAADLIVENCKSFQPTWQESLSVHTTGLNFIGLFSTYDYNNRYFKNRLLFTCLVLRDVNLEKLSDLSTDSTKHCIKCFLCWRRTPIKVISDNGSSGKLSELLSSKFWFQRQTIAHGQTITQECFFFQFASRDSFWWQLEATSSNFSNGLSIKSLVRKHCKITRWTPSYGKSNPAGTRVL